uniref:Uncharacterized protein n=1 Tax=Candidatus Kentrum sp. LPFa TaxID=2126335 RepID=A0A450W3R6_9GAMM|nr:MAG: hypothetical protein BECKLPF1236B_GA0070989_10238 [Candidatus Kentron sp. LPFa]
MRAHTLPNRFRDNGVTPEILAELDSTPASMSDADRVLVEQIDEYEDTKNRKLSFRETGTEKGLTDKLAARIKSLEIAPNGNSPFGFSVETDIDTDIGDLTDSGGGVIEEIIRAISTTTGQTFAFNLAQQFGHAGKGPDVVAQGKRDSRHCVCRAESRQPAVVAAGFCKRVRSSLASAI